jgi:hypothetical protein
MRADEDDADAPEERRSQRRRHSDVESAALNGSVPAWLRAAVLLGVPSVIALFLVWVMTQSVSTRLVRIEGRQEALMESYRGTVDDVHAINDELRTLERLIRSMCATAADTPDERALCGAP